MFSKSFIAVVLSALMAGQALGIATDPYYACNCPNNCDREINTSCKYYENHSNTGPIVDGRCKEEGNGIMMCIKQQ